MPAKYTRYFADVDLLKYSAVHAQASNSQHIECAWPSVNFLGWMNETLRQVSQEEIAELLKCSRSSL
jgi:hypothetical protein